MTRIAKLLALGVVAAAFGQVICASAAGAGLAGTITPNCVLAGGSVTVSLSGATAGAVISFQTSYGGSQANEAAQSAVGTANASGVFATTFAISSSTSPGQGMVSVLEFDTSGMSAGVGNYTIGAAPGGCPSPGIARFEVNEVTPTVKYSVQKTCDAGVTGEAVFEPSVVIVQLTTVYFPPMTLRCNAAPVPFPAVLAGASVKFHEKTAPAGAIPAADVWAGIPPDTLVVIHNSKAAATVTPTPTAALKLAQTGTMPLSAIGFLAAGFVLIGLGVLLFGRRRTV